MYTGGTIPSELCITDGLYLDITNTNIHCYSGCLTSAKVIIEGATNICPNGSIMKLFITIISICIIFPVISAVLYKYRRSRHAIVNMGNSWWAEWNWLKSWDK